MNRTHRKPKSRIPERKPLLRAALILSAVATLAIVTSIMSPADALGTWLFSGVGMVNQLISRQDSDRGGHPVAASTTIYQGTLAFINASGYLDDDTANGANKFAGIAVEYCDNSGGSNGDLKVDLWREGKFVLTGTGFAQTDVLKPAYATDNYTVSPIPTDNAVYIGIISEYISATKVVVELDTKEQRIAYLSETFAIGDFTDNANTTGYVDFTGALPVGAIVLGWKAVVATGFTGDTTAVAQVGVSGDLDRFSALTTGSVLAAGTIGNQPADDSSAFISAATTPRVTVTGGSDFGGISAGSMTVTIAYVKF